MDRLPFQISDQGGCGSNAAPPKDGREAAPSASGFFRNDFGPTRRQAGVFQRSARRSAVTAAFLRPLDGPFCGLQPPSNRLIFGRGARKIPWEKLSFALRYFWIIAGGLLKGGELRRRSASVDQQKNFTRTPYRAY
jgi:hypothetical protein